VEHKKYTRPAWDKGYPFREFSVGNSAHGRSKGVSMPKFGSSGGYYLLSPKGKRFKDALKPLASYDEAVAAARVTAIRIASEGRRDPVYVLGVVASVKSPAPTPVEVTEIDSN